MFRHNLFGAQQVNTRSLVPISRLAPGLHRLLSRRCRMGRPRKKREPLPPIWRGPDELWAIAGAIIAELDPPNRVGPKRVPARPILDAIIYRGRTGCQWNHLPEEYPDDSTVHRAFQRWKRLGVFERLWAVLIERCEDLDGVDWEWQAGDGAMGKARKGGAMSGRTQPTARRVA